MKAAFVLGEKRFVDPDTGLITKQKPKDGKSLGVYIVEKICEKTQTITLKRKSLCNQ